MVLQTTRQRRIQNRPTVDRFIAAAEIHLCQPFRHGLGIGNQQHAIHDLLAGIVHHDDLLRAAIMLLAGTHDIDLVFTEHDFVAGGFHRLAADPIRQTVAFRNRPEGSARAGSLRCHGMLWDDLARMRRWWGESPSIAAATTIFLRFTSRPDCP